MRLRRCLSHLDSTSGHIETADAQGRDFSGTETGQCGEANEQPELGMFARRMSRRSWGSGDRVGELADLAKIQKHHLARRTARDCHAVARVRLQAPALHRGAQHESEHTLRVAHRSRCLALGKQPRHEPPHACRVDRADGLTRELGQHVHGEHRLVPGECLRLQVRAPGEPRGRPLVEGHSAESRVEPVTAMQVGFDEGEMFRRVGLRGERVLRRLHAPGRVAISGLPAS